MPSGDDKIVQIHHDRVSNTVSTDFPGYYPGEDNSWNLEEFKNSFDIKIATLNEDTANFDLIGIDTAIANAFRRIMIAEIPTVALETINIYNNTSIIQDEVLAQRLGLIPLKVDPDWLNWFDPNAIVEPSTEAGEEPSATTTATSLHNSTNTIQFSLHVKCERNPNAPKNATDSEQLYINSNVYSRDLKYVPFGGQEEWMKPAPGVVNGDILIAKLRPGQEIQLDGYAILGIGADHAKFSPVSTASYRLLPTIDIVGSEPITGELAEKFKACFSPGVVEINSKGEAYIADARRDTVSREVLRHNEFKDRVKLGRKRDHFIFNVESTGAMPPEEIFVKSVAQLRNKCKELLQYDLHDLPNASST